jgi:predicted amidophosphoribosyltransferase/DNA-binding HxlR family transcriptional regulator
MKNAQNNTADNILQYIRTNKQARPADLSDSIGVSLQMIHRSLKDLLEQRMIKKTGSAPRVFYSLDKNQDEKSSHSVESEKTKVSKEQYEIIDKNFYNLLPDGTEEYGFEAFIHWCNKRKYEIKQKAKEYVDAILPFEKLENEKYAIDVTSKIKTTFKDNVYLDELWYLYPYSIAIFGKTKISQLIFHAKQTQDIALMKRAFTIIENRIHQYIDYIKPDAVAFIPPTVPRKKQIMKELKKFLSLHIPEIQIEKIKTGILVQQKTLKDLDDRVYNAKHTMVVTSKVNKPYKKLLLIDDFTGSGSTLNQVAKKCKEQGVAEEVIGLTLTGSINGFDVLREI